MSDLNRPHEIAKQHAPGSRGNGGGSFAGEVLVGVILFFIGAVALMNLVMGITTHSAWAWLWFWRSVGFWLIVSHWKYLWNTIVMRVYHTIRSGGWRWTTVPSRSFVILTWLGVVLVLAPWIPGMLMHGIGHRGRMSHADNQLLTAVIIDVIVLAVIVGLVALSVSMRRRGVSPLWIPFGMLALVFSRLFFTSRGSSPGHPGVNHNPFDNDDHNSGSWYSE